MPAAARYCLVGRDVSKSPSPDMMNAAFRAASVDAHYEAISVAEGDFSRTIHGLLSRGEDGVAGMNVTIPYKEHVVRVVDELDSVSLRIQAVNTVKRDETSGGRYLGYNTDPDGIVGPLRRIGVEKEIQNAVLIGAGGAARSFCESMNRIGCRGIAVAVREPARAQLFAIEMEKAFPRLNLTLLPFASVHRASHDLIFNASPIGSGGIPLPEPLRSLVPGSKVVFDAVYLPRDTELLQEASKAGCSVVRGQEMLLHQAFATFRIWTGREAPREAMEEALTDALKRRESEAGAR